MFEYITNNNNKKKHNSNCCCYWRCFISRYFFAASRCHKGNALSAAKTFCIFVARRVAAAASAALFGYATRRDNGTLRAPTSALSHSLSESYALVRYIIIWHTHFIFVD